MIDWIICGSESGPGARPAPLEWVRSVRDQVMAAREYDNGCLHSDHDIYPDQPCRGCKTVQRQWRGPALFIKQIDVCEWCSGTGKSTGADGEMPRSCPSPCKGTGQTGKVRKGCPAIDGRVWDEVPR